jgi:microcompartment protein CcmL/EutN
MKAQGHRATGRFLFVVCVWCAFVAAPMLGMSASLATLTSRDAAGGLRAALSQGIDTAVAQLGARDGFLNDPKVSIPLPPVLEKANQALRMVGMGGDADALKAAMNHAAEAAVANAGPVFKRAVQHMTVEDAKRILTGGDDAGTQYFRNATSTELSAQFKPVVARETAKLKLVSRYDEYAGKAASLGLMPAQDANLNDYVTAYALDGLFSRIADEERAIRKDPLGQASSLIKKVFSAVR